MSRQLGIIAHHTAEENKGPTFAGYDLRVKQKPSNYHHVNISDFELIYNGFGCERDNPVPANKLFENLNRSICKVHVDQLKTEEALNKASQEAEETKKEVNGKILKNVYQKGEGYRFDLQCNETEEIKKAVQSMVNAWSGAMSKRIEMEFAVICQLRKGTLDIAEENGQEFLVEFHENGPVRINENRSIPIEKIKESIYFMIQPFRYSEELFLKYINCEHTTDGFTALYEKGKLYFEKRNGTPFTEIEIAIAKDLIKMKM